MWARSCCPASSGETLWYWARAPCCGWSCCLWGLSLMFSSVDSNAAGESFLHLINLPFHEFGHVLFSPFGDYMRSLGGTLGQLLMPAICCGALLVGTKDSPEYVFEQEVQW